MFSYFKKSLGKFKEDVLSKVVYDVLKGVVIAAILFSMTKLLPEDFSITKTLSMTFSISVYGLILVSLFIIGITSLVLRGFYRRRFNALRLDNFTDELTGLKNHKALKECLVKKIDAYKSNPNALCIILIDIDDFKKLNTEVGYNTANRILEKVGHLLANDKRITDEIFRQFLHGDEFIIITSDTNLASARMAAERKRKLIESASLLVEGKHYHITVSCGVTELNKKEDDYIRLTDRAQSALKEAKSQHGKNCTRAVV